MKNIVKITESDLYLIIKQTVNESILKESVHQDLVKQITEDVIRKLNEKMNSFDQMAQDFGYGETANAIAKYFPYNSKAEEFKKGVLNNANRYRTKQGLEPFPEDTPFEDVVNSYNTSRLRRTIGNFDKSIQGYGYNEWPNEVATRYGDEYEKGQGFKPTPLVNFPKRYKGKSALVTYQEQMRIIPELRPYVNTDAQSCRRIGKVYARSKSERQRKIGACLIKYAELLTSRIAS